MRTRLAIASTLVLGLSGCGGADDGVAESGPDAYESSESPASQTLAQEAPAELPDVAAAPMPEDAVPSANQEAGDVEITRKIREQLVAGSEPLSSQAQNVTVDSDHGVVTVRGPVENEREREIVLSIARATEGVTRVEDRLEIAQR